MKRIYIWLTIIGAVLIVICGIGVMVEGKKAMSENQRQQKHFKETYHQKIETLDIDSDSRNIEIRKGHTYSIDNIATENNMSSKVSNGKWVVKNHTKKPVINFRPFNSNDKVIITVPATELKKLTINVDSQQLKMDGINSKETNIYSDSSQTNINNSTLGDTKLTNDSGQMTVHHFKFHKLNIVNDSGQIELTKLTADQPIQVKNDSGTVNIQFANKPYNSKLTINNDAGNVDVDKNIFPHHKLGHGKYAIDIINDSGTVEIK
ncbi:DUF4097 family beta strand repeat protein [Staphylococcus simiae]|uniref:DUF4097 family beta strand repeat-containing protein n=1 Tax=Staphylococcus simiae TaxID=308354 RepID=UPI001A956D0B|nr:DUF4097 family beta strand repeat-containing protein [Staphylococcus simiae]MBO1198654.1 DUF4097 family beta strand repeat protein [Staphylococcus simiae]MBO1200861.1 DUF4097 family beta strand repeat protein [Staphylococcus simiae]MBO1203069.1 DUF4097 family beta strand repeat protein [Staphylococcus simiae]MBO1211280.1 DUF4097 family beta strand repeat protein [Staphylococcus simiae]MBO1229197.1 DUF4097 family beta strand repeat protein [Staphylococcus simiae]